MTTRAIRAVPPAGRGTSSTGPRPPGSAMFSEQAWTEIAHSLRLSGRELQIVRSTFDDQTEFAMAINLGVAPRTVHTHVERLHRKLAVMDRTQLVVRVMQQFLSLTVSPENSLPPLCNKRAAGRCPGRLQ